jgi:hypothetical protein
MSRMRQPARQPARWRASLHVPLVLAASALLPSSAAAQSKTASTNQTDQQTTVPDSAHAVNAACAIVHGLREPGERARCVVEGFQDTGSEYVVRVREQTRRGTPPPSFSRSVVRLKKSGIEATITREPEL